MCPRWGAAAVTLLDGRILVTGGRGSVGALNDVWHGNADGRHWTLIREQSDWAARAGHSLVVLADGSVLQLGHRNEVWHSEDLGRSWIR